MEGCHLLGLPNGFIPGPFRLHSKYGLVPVGLVALFPAGDGFVFQGLRLRESCWPAEELPVSADPSPQGRGLSDPRTAIGEVAMGQLDPPKWCFLKHPKKVLFLQTVRVPFSKGPTVLNK